MPKNLAPETYVAQGMHRPDPVTGELIPSIQPSTTFARDENYELIAQAHSYARDENPSYLTAERMLAQLEGGDEALLTGWSISAHVGGLSWTSLTLPTPMILRES
jgi:cystathionine gamma-synthase